ncbi:hypothetical protein SGLAM104S_01192 [Streptomyces glaucescens]
MNGVNWKTPSSAPPALSASPYRLPRVSFRAASRSSSQVVGTATPASSRTSRS